MQSYDDDAFLDLRRQSLYIDSSEGTPYTTLSSLVAAVITLLEGSSKANQWGINEYANHYIYQQVCGQFKQPLVSGIYIKCEICPVAGARPNHKFVPSHLPGLRPCGCIVCLRGSVAAQTHKNLELHITLCFMLLCSFTNSPLHHEALPAALSHENTR